MQKSAAEEAQKARDQEEASVLTSTAALQPVPEFDAAGPAHAKLDNMSGAVAKLGSGAAGGKVPLQGLLSASDPLVEARCGLSGGQVVWHSALEQV